MSITIIIALVWVHMFADFVCQSDKMATSKSTSNKWLAIHVLVYSAFLIPFGWKFAAINYVLHFITDYISSRVTSYLWKRQERHWFFVVIGIDQAFHMTALFVTYQWIGGGVWGSWVDVPIIQ